MAARFRVTTNDLTVQFFEKSFTVIGHCVYTGRKVEKEDGAGIAKIMQRLVDHGTYKATGKFIAVSDTFTVADEHLITENEQLKDDLEASKAELVSMQDELDYWQHRAIK